MSLERDRVEHFRQRWAEENFNHGIVNPSLSSGASTADRNLTEVSAPQPLVPKTSSLGIRGLVNSHRSWRESLGFGSRSQSRSREHLTEVAAAQPYAARSESKERSVPGPTPKRHTFQPRHPDEETALPTLPDDETEASDIENHEESTSPWVSEIYIISYLIFFSLLGVLSRLGVEAITQYPNAPVTSRVLWANVGGSFFMGFLGEDKTLFRKRRTKHQKEHSQQEAVAEHKKWKKTIPLFIGLTTGYCGSFTSFSTFIRDVFLEMTNGLPSPSSTQAYQSMPTIAPRNAGFSFLALIAILVIQPAVSIAALLTGAQFALFAEPVTPNLSQKVISKFLNPLMVFLAVGCWLVGSLVLAIIPPYNATEWRSRAMFPLIFSPLGCLLRYYLSKHLNALDANFPWGTFASNIFGTVILGMSWDLQHADAPGLGVQSALACAVLVGVQEGFCGCLTTVSTWVVELTSLDRKHAWIYGTASVLAGFSSLILIMGSVGWTVGFGQPACG